MLDIFISAFALEKNFFSFKLRIQFLIFGQDLSGIEGIL